MAPEEMQRTMEFIVSQQAQLTATVGTLAEAQARLTATVERLAERVESVSAKVDRNAEKVYSDGTRVNSIHTLASLVHRRGVRRPPVAALHDSTDAKRNQLVPPS